MFFFLSVEHFLISIFQHYIVSIVLKHFNAKFRINIIRNKSRNYINNIHLIHLSQKIFSSYFSKSYKTTDKQEF